MQIKTYKATFTYTFKTKATLIKHLKDNKDITAIEEIKATSFKEARNKLREKHGYDIKNIQVEEIK